MAYFDDNHVIKMKNQLHLNSGLCTLFSNLMTINLTIITTLWCIQSREYIFAFYVFIYGLVEFLAASVFFWSQLKSNYLLQRAALTFNLPGLILGLILSLSNQKAAVQLLLLIVNTMVCDDCQFNFIDKIISKGQIISTLYFFNYNLILSFGLSFVQVMDNIPTSLSFILNWLIRFVLFAECSINAASLFPIISSILSI